MALFSYKETPLKVYGMPYFYKDGTSKRLPREMAERMYFGVCEWGLDVRSPGARLAFRTDSPKITIRIRFTRISPDVGISLYGAQSANVYIGRGKEARYAGLIVPKDGYNSPEVEGTIEKQPVMEDVMVFLPRNEAIEDILVEVEDGFQVEEPTPYKYPVPVLYYGSSITEGASASKAANAYNAILSRELDCDFINYGLSGSARGELFVADFLSEIPKSVFVMDYDYNAPDAAHLKATHEPFYQRLREKEPDLPIIMITGPRTEPQSDYAQERVKIIRDTYEHAIANGDKKVWFIDGSAFWGDNCWERYNCTADNIHPNDLGMVRMAERIRPVLQEALASFLAAGDKH